MAHNKLFKLIEDDNKLTAIVSNLSSTNIEQPYIIQNTIDILGDTSPFFNFISDSNKRALCIMLSQYVNNCYSIYIEDKQLNKILEYGKIKIYSVNASNGLRKATTNEIAQGVRGLIGEDMYIAGEEEYKKICLLQWTFTGVSYFFRQAGFRLSYSPNGAVENSFYDMIQMSALQIKELFEWLEDRRNYDNAIKQMKKLKSKHGYKYATYASDEITEDITIKQLIYNIHKTFPVHSTNNDYRRALALSIKAEKGTKLEPLDISFLRETYDKYAMDQLRDKKVDMEEVEGLREKCETLLKNRYSGLINPNHFAYKIISSLKRIKYTKCSPKQYAIIDSALATLNGVEEPEEQEPVKIIDDSDIDNTLELLSQAVSQEIFEDGD